MPRVKSLETGQGFKTTEIGEIPVDWKISRIYDHTELITKGTTPTTYRHKYTDSGVRFFRIENINQQGQLNSNDIKHISNNTNNFLDRSKLKSGDIIFSIAGALGRTAIISDEVLPANINQALALIRLNDKKIDKIYIMYILQSEAIKHQIETLAAQLAQANLNLQQVGNLKFPLPPLPEQKRIAEILSAVDEAIDKWSDFVDKTKILKKGLMQQLLTSGIGHSKFETTELGRIPIDWEVVKIGDICEVIGGSTPSTKKKEYWDGGIPWATPTDITNLKGNVITETEKTITRLGLTHSAAKLLPEGSILLTSRATIGECAINSVPMATNKGFASLDCKDSVHNWFIYYYISLVKDELQRLAGGSTFREVSKRSIKAIRIPLPPLPEQKRIAEILSAVDERIDSALAYKEKLEALKKGLMQALLSGKVRVKA
jgi:type I restriction enzyme S subunit